MNRSTHVEEALVSGPDQLRALVKGCLAERRSLVDYGVAHQGLGNPPPAQHVRLRQRGEVLEHWERDFTVRVAAGATLGQVRQQLAKTGQFLPLEADEDVSVGEAIVHNAYGPLRVGYGGPRDLLLGLRYVDGNGEEVHAGGRTVKNVAGYDLTRLMVGSLGELGVVYEATLRTYAVPAQVLAVTVGVADPADADRLVPQLLLTDAAPAYLSLGRESERWVLQAGYFGSSAACAAQLQALQTLVEQTEGMHILGSGTRDLVDDELSRRGRSAWRRTAEAVVKLVVPPGHCGSVAAEILENEDFTGTAALSTTRVVPGAGALPGGGVHVEVLPVHGCVFVGGKLDAAGARALEAAVSRLIEDVGGVRTWHRRPKGAEDIPFCGPPQPDWPMLRKLKKAMDPAGIFNPGRFLA